MTTYSTIVSLFDSHAETGTSSNELQSHGFDMHEATHGLAEPSTRSTRVPPGTSKGTG